MQATKPVFSIMRGKRPFSIFKSNKEDAEGDGLIHVQGSSGIELSRLGPKEYLVELLIGIRKDLNQEMCEYE